MAEKTYKPGFKLEVAQVESGNHAGYHTLLINGEATERYYSNAHGVARLIRTLTQGVKAGSISIPLLRSSSKTPISQGEAEAHVAAETEWLNLPTFEARVEALLAKARAHREKKKAAPKRVPRDAA